MKCKKGHYVNHFALIHFRIICPICGSMLEDANEDQSIEIKKSKPVKIDLNKKKSENKELI